MRKETHEVSSEEDILETVPRLAAKKYVEALMYCKKNGFLHDATKNTWREYLELCIAEYEKRNNKENRNEETSI